MSKDVFIKVYSNLPLNVRREVVAVVEFNGEETPVSWDVAYKEIRNETALGKEILKKLTELEII